MVDMIQTEEIWTPAFHLLENCMLHTMINPIPMGFRNSRQPPWWVKIDTLDW